MENPSPFPNDDEATMINVVKAALAECSIKYTKQEFGRGLKLHGKKGHTRVTFHIYNVEDVA